MESSLKNDAVKLAEVQRFAKQPGRRLVVGEPKRGVKKKVRVEVPKEIGAPASGIEIRLANKS